VKLAVEQRSLALARPHQTAHGELRTRELLLVSVTGEDGLTGWGEAAPMESYDGVSLAAVHDALARYEPLLADFERSGDHGARLLERCRDVADVPQALAALDLALWDRAGRRTGKPVAQLLCGDPEPSVRVNATIAALDRGEAARAAAEATAAGFDCVKLKVGVGDDGGRVAAVRAAIGPHVALRLDANGAWDVEQAVASIDALAPAGLELVEEPTHGLHAMAEVRARTAARVSIDETAVEPGALTAGVADAVCLKVSSSGGIGRLLAAAALVRATGAEVYLASTLDGPIGVAAALHVAAALASRGPVPHCGLATLSAFADLDDPLPARDGAITLPDAPGLGVEPF
jgi:L-alanine-DL-glutamate epimerase-like enolase superfamily enzyme